MLVELNSVEVVALILLILVILWRYGRVHGGRDIGSPQEQPNAGKCRSFRRDSLSRRGADFRDLQVQADSFAIDQYEAGVNELLTGAIKLFIGAQHREREYKFHGDNTTVRVLVAAQTYRRTKVDSVEIAAVFLEIR